MTILAAVVIAWASWPWACDGWDAWKHYRLVRREARLLDQELEFLS